MIQFLLNLFSSRPALAQIQIVKRDPMRITMDEWRSNPDLARLAAKALSDPTVRQMLDILYRSQFLKIVLSPDTSEHVRATHQAQCEGYVMAIADLEALGVYQRPTQEIESTFAPENLDITLNP